MLNAFLFFEVVAQVGCGVGGVVFEEGVERFCGGDLAAELAGIGAEVDYVVGVCDDVEVVFDDDEGCTTVYEGVKDGDDFGNVIEVEAGGRFIKDIEGVGVCRFGEFAGEAEPSKFAGREGLCLLS